MRFRLLMPRVVQSKKRLLGFLAHEGGRQLQLEQICFAPTGLSVVAPASAGWIYVCAPAPVSRRRSGNTRYTTVGEIIAHPSPSSSAAVDAMEVAGSALLLLLEASETEPEEHEEGVLKPPGIRCQYSLRGIVGWWWLVVCGRWDGGGDAEGSETLEDLKCGRVAESGIELNSGLSGRRRGEPITDICVSNVDIHSASLVDTEPWSPRSIVPVCTEECKQYGEILISHFITARSLRICDRVS